VVQTQLLETAVRGLARFSPKFNWVGVYLLNGDVLELGPYVGAKTEHTTIPVGRGVCGTAVAENRDLNVPDVSQTSNYLACSLETRSELVVLIRDRAHKVVAQIDIDSHSTNAFGPAEEAEVRRVAQELGKQWQT
jgi:L-methionine (R)-S-oxide reductase